jgi:hypothetical protein
MATGGANDFSGSIVTSPHLAAKRLKTVYFVEKLGIQTADIGA